MILVIKTISDDKKYISYNVFTLQLADWLIVYFLDRILTISDDKEYISHNGICTICHQISSEFCLRNIDDKSVG
jgi:hypothetical protein